MLSLLGQPASAQTDLTFFKNYFVTGDYVVGGVGLRGLGDVTGFATGKIPPPGVPAGADVVAAFLYWQTVEKSQSAFAGRQGFFNGRAITGRELGNPNAPVSWSAGGCAGSSQGTTTLRTYRADVRPFLTVLAGTDPYQVRLADSGSNGGGAPLTLGATLVIIYRELRPDRKQNAVSIYDGTFAPGNGSQSMNLSIQGFYQADYPTTPVAKITHIVGNGQLNKTEALLFNGTTISTAPFPGLLNGSWDNPTFSVGAGSPVGPLVPPGDVNPVTTAVIPAATNSGCVSWGAVIFSTTVQDTDNDGLLDVWETNQGYTDVGSNAWVALQGADPGLSPSNPLLTKDIFIQIDYLASHDSITSGGAQGHSHKPKQPALDMVAAAFAAQGIQLHIDLAASAIDEDTVTCRENLPTTPSTHCEFPDQPATSWKGGFTFLKNQHFQRGRKDSYHYVLFGHELGLAANIWSISGGTLSSIVVNGATGIATVNTSSTQGYNSGDRVRVSGAIADFNLNGTYPVISFTSTQFTISTPNVKTGTYNNPGLFAASGPARSTSGWSDLGGADTSVTLGLWRSDIAADDQVGNALTQAGTFAHELGHTLGLKHGGVDITNCKSNYQSVMNYLFQIRGLIKYADGLAYVDYSAQALPDLSEGGLSESQGIGSAATTYRTRWFAPLNFLDTQLNNVVNGRPAKRHCDGTPITDLAQMVRMEGPLVAGPIDWNNNNTTTDSGLAQDINFNNTGFNHPLGSNVDSLFVGANDWANIDLRQIGARRGVFGFSGDVWGTLDDGSGGTLDDGSGGTLDDGSGGTLDDGSGGTLDDGSGGSESDFDRANSTVDPPNNVTAALGVKSVVLTWTPPGFGRIRAYYIWRADTTNVPISSTNLPVKISTLTGTTGSMPPPTNFTDQTVKNNTTYTYFVTSALGTDSGPNNGNQSGPSNMVQIKVKF